MSIIYFNSPPNEHGGGPSVFVWKTVTELTKRGHKIVYNKGTNVDVALCIINVGNIIKKMGKTARIVLRTNGIYNDLYNKKFNRAIRPDMIQLHKDLEYSLPRVDHVIFQSKWSQDRIFDEIIKIDKNYSVINNGVDINLFKPLNVKKTGTNLIHIGRMRDFYLMNTLIGTYKEVCSRGIDANLILVGGMDGGCKRALDAHGTDLNIKLLGSIPNSSLANAYAKGDILLDVRQGASCNNIVPEAQSCGLPVLTAKWGGGGEMIVNGSTGVIVDGGEWDYNQNYINNLADGVELIMGDLSGFKKRSRAHAVAELGIDKMVNKYLKAMGL